MQPQRDSCTRQQAADKRPPPGLRPASLVQEAPSYSGRWMYFGWLDPHMAELERLSHQSGIEPSCTAPNDARRTRRCLKCRGCLLSAPAPPRC